MAQLTFVAVIGIPILFGSRNLFGLKLSDQTPKFSSRWLTTYLQEGRVQIVVKKSTRDLILETAQALAQARGFNAYSYADIAVELGIRKASIHYHFPYKHDLEMELLERYRSGFIAEMGNIESNVENSIERLECYAQLYANTLKKDQICLCGMMASDAGALSVELAPPLKSFFEEHVDWLAKVIDAGESSGELSFEGSARAQASVFLAALQGGLLIANGVGDEAVLKSIVGSLMNQLR